MPSIFKKCFLKNESGVAIMVALGAIIVMTMVTVEFVFDAQIDYNLALRQKERMQAYYLAQSSYNLGLLELKLGSIAEKQIASFLQQTGVSIGVDLSEPLCKQLPLNSALFRLGMDAEGGGKEGASGEVDKSLLSSFPLSGVKDFLQFSGDFSVECEDESAKLNLNFFADQDPAKETITPDNPYDDYKKLLIRVLSQQRYTELFEAAEISPQDMVRNIADWVDQNETVNDFGRQERGGEEALYHGNTPGQMTTKNGKFSTPEEIYQVAGVRDSLWIPLSEMFTIYGVTGEQGRVQINICRSSDEVIKGMILRYAESRSDLPPIKPEEEEGIQVLVDKVNEVCNIGEPDKNEIAAAVDGGLAELLKIQQNSGGAGGGFESVGSGGEKTVAEGEGEPKSAGAGGSVSLFADWITTESRFFTLNGTGQVGKTTVRIKAVVDLGEPGGTDTAKWKTIYWKIY